MEKLKISCIMIMMFSFFSCGNTNKNGVFLSELPSPPEIIIEGEHMNIKVENSIKNSAKSIYKIDFELEKNIFHIKATQKLSNLPLVNYQNSIDIDLKEVNLESIKCYWINPDGDKHELEIKK